MTGMSKIRRENFVVEKISSVLRDIDNWTGEGDAPDAVPVSVEDLRAFRDVVLRTRALLDRANDQLDHNKSLSGALMGAATALASVVKSKR